MFLKQILLCLKFYITQEENAFILIYNMVSELFLKLEIFSDFLEPNIPSSFESNMVYDTP